MGMNDIAEAVAWLTMFVNADPGERVYGDLDVSVPSVVEDQLEPYRLEKPTVLYRGLAWSDVDDFKEDMNAWARHYVDLKTNKVYKDIPPLKVGGKFPGTLLGISSWTKDIKVARDFAKKGLGIVLKAKVEPDQTLVDMTRLPKDICTDLPVACRESEVVTTDDHITGEIIELYERINGSRKSVKEIAVASFRQRVRAAYVVAEDYSLYTDESGKYWGSQGAGGVFYAEDTGRVCLAHRSKRVNEPDTWGTWGGAIEDGEDPAEALRRELGEESGYDGSMTLQEVYVFQDKKFRYTNFLIIVPHEFKPKLDWETQGYKWTTIDQLPSPLHPGMQKLLPHLRKALKKGVTAGTERQLKNALVRWVEKSDIKPLEKLYRDDPSLFSGYSATPDKPLYRAIAIEQGDLERLQNGGSIKKSTGPFESYTSELSFAKDFLEVHTDVKDGMFGIIVEKRIDDKHFLFKVCDVVDDRHFAATGYCHENEYLALAVPHTWDEVVWFMDDDGGRKVG